jgi:SH3/ankyrin repeat-containing protein
MATSAKKPQKLLIALVNGGALLDYRTKDGSTSLHRAVERDCLEAVS